MMPMQEMMASVWLACPFRLFHLGAPCPTKHSKSRAIRRGWQGCGPRGRIWFPV
jgi:hypothetical protein